MNDNKKEVSLYIDTRKEYFAEISEKIWEYAELSLKEFKSSELYINALKKEGFEVETDIAGIKTAFSGKFGSGKPVIAILGEFDALSGLSQRAEETCKTEYEKGGNGHGCGHNLLGAGALASAFAVKDYLEKTKRSGTVVFCGCPGEEGGAGKAFMAKENYWKNFDAAITWHPSDENVVATGTCNSSIQVLYKFKGISAHAAGCPEMGRSALDAVELMNVGVQYLREHVKPDARIHYAMIDSGGFSPNVVQNSASVLYMIRSIKVKDALELKKRVDDIAKGASLMTGTEYEIEFIDGTSNTVPNHTLEKVLFDNMTEIGAPGYSDDETEFAKKLTLTYDKTGYEAGSGYDYSKNEKEYINAKSESGAKALNDFILPLYSGYSFSPGSTDVGDISWQIPTAQVYTVAFPSGAPGHSWQNVSCANSKIGIKGMIFAAKILALSAVDLFEDGSILEKAKNEFTENSKEGFVSPIPDGAIPKAL